MLLVFNTARHELSNWTPQLYCNCLFHHFTRSNDSLLIFWIRVRSVS